jgi:hypothetical protein
MWKGLRCESCPRDHPPDAPNVTQTAGLHLTNGLPSGIALCRSSAKTFKSCPGWSRIPPMKRPADPPRPPIPLQTFPRL